MARPAVSLVTSEVKPEEIQGAAPVSADCAVRVVHGNIIDGDKIYAMGDEMILPRKEAELLASVQSVIIL